MADVYSATRSETGTSRLPRPSFDAMLFGGLALLVAAAWMVKDAHYLSAERGIGYAFGICGVSCMIGMQLYSLRKRMPGLLPGIPLRYLFRTHMYLGVVGPTLILLHCNFRMGSANSRVAFWSMVIMVASGAVGRFIYGRIHAGLYGERVKLEALAKAVADRRAALDGEVADLRALERPCTSLTGQWLLHMRALRVRRRALTADGSQGIRAYFEQLLALSRMRLAERAFALWHVVHLPLVALLAVSVAAHVIVVHAY